MTPIFIIISSINLVGQQCMHFSPSDFCLRKGLGSGKGLLKMLTDDVTAEEKTQTRDRALG